MANTRSSSKRIVSIGLALAIVLGTIFVVAPAMPLDNDISMPRYKWQDFQNKVSAWKAELETLDEELRSAQRELVSEAPSHLPTPRPLKVQPESDPRVEEVLRRARAQVDWQGLVDERERELFASIEAQIRWAGHAYAAVKLMNEALGNPRKDEDPVRLNASKYAAACAALREALGP